MTYFITRELNSMSRLSPIRDPEGNELPKSVMNKIILFQKKQKKDTIDVWWLSDDGGIRHINIFSYFFNVRLNRFILFVITRTHAAVAGYHQHSFKLV